MSHSSQTRVQLRTVCLFIALGLLVGCQPSDEDPGLWLKGTEVTRPVTDWTFTQSVDEILIETQPWYGLPHSTTIWCVQLDGALYIGSYGNERKHWEKSIANDPRARLSIQGDLYPVQIRPVIEGELSQQILERYNQKYDMEEVFGKDVPEWWFYQVEQPEASAKKKPS